MYREQALLDNLKSVQDSLYTACKNAGRSAQAVTLMAVTKYAKDEDVLALLSKGVLSDIGESRVQQAWARWKENPAFTKFTDIKKHFIGHLQKNKAAKAAVLFDYIDSLDDPETARVLSTHVPPGKTLRALVQVKLSQKETQSGLPLIEARQLAKTLLGRFKNVDVCGYMAVAPQGASEAELRRLFADVKAAFDADFKDVPGAHLSLGMSEDFVVAVEMGSTLPRIGSLLFK